MTTRQAMALGTAGFTAMLAMMALEAHGLEPGFAVEGDGKYRADWGWLGGAGSVINPKCNDPDGPILETATRFQEIATSPKSILCVEAMGARDDLWLTSRDTSASPLTLAQDLGSVRGAEVVCLGDDVDLASVLFEMGLPAVRVATRPIVTPNEPDDQPPSATTVAASAGRLIELIRRCAAAP